MFLNDRRGSDSHANAQPVCLSLRFGIDCDGVLSDSHKVPAQMYHSVFGEYINASRRMR